MENSNGSYCDPGSVMFVEGFAGTPPHLQVTASHKTIRCELEQSKGKGYGSGYETDGPVLSSLGDR